MSYILDALRRAEAERQRGTVPGLHAQPATGTLPAGPDGTHTAQRSWRPGTWALAGLLLAGLLAAAAALGWLLKPTPEVVAVTLPTAPPPAAVRSAVPAVPLQAAALAAGGAQAQPPTPALALAPAAVAVAPVVTRISPEARPSTEPAAAPTRPLVSAASATAVAAPASATAVAAPASTAALSAPAAAPVASPRVVPAPVVAGPGTAPARLPTLAELPEALRREVQPLNLGGSVYAEQPPLRIVIINGQVFHEGDKPLPALQVQQIRLKSVVFSVRGQRFEVPL